MAYTLRPAAAGDIDAVFALFEQRVDWMNRQSIHQWNDTDYLNVYPKTYYQQQRELGNLYVLADNTDGAVAGAVVLLQSDDRWLDRAGSPPTTSITLSPTRRYAALAVSCWRRRSALRWGMASALCGWTAPWTTPF